VIYGILIEQNWAAAKRIAIEHEKDFEREDYQADGVQISAGDSWRRPFIE
jgi:hypothetical protein